MPSAVCGFRWEVTTGRQHRVNLIGSNKKQVKIRHFNYPAQAKELNVNDTINPARARNAGPKGLRAESARAVTGRREDFLSRQQDFLRKQL